MNKNILPFDGRSTEPAHDPATPEESLYFLTLFASISTKHDRTCAIESLEAFIAGLNNKHA